MNQHFRKTIKYAQMILFICSLFVISTFVLTVGAYTIAKLLGPPPIEVPQSTTFYADDGSKFAESNINGQMRIWVPLDEISPYAISATIAIEDQRFYSHIGFDLKRIAGAVLTDVKARAKVQGASTISQQYARNLFLSHEKTWSRKLKEALYTIRLEANYSKKEILEGYLNTIYYGHGTYGIEAASRYYFQKGAGDLTLAEAALLASIPKGPSSYSPFLNYENAKKRQELVLSEMVEQGIITKEEADLAKSEKLHLVGKVNNEMMDIAPYFKDVVYSELIHSLGIDERTITLGGLQIYTTLDPRLQKIAEEKIQTTIPSSSKLQVGFIAMDPTTGYVKALVGGRDYNESSFNRAVSAVRQPGSTMKPILYYAALEKGFTPTTMFRSEETTFTFADGRDDYKPQNFNYAYPNDEITMLQALALSDNIYAVKTHLYLGMDALADYAKKFGILSPQTEVPSLALGSSGVKLVEMANAYSYFANGGKYVEPVYITKVVNRNGEVIYEHQSQSVQVLDPDVTFVMSHMLTGIFDPNLNGYANVTGSTVLSKLTRTYAGKSGSTDTDAWMIGYTPELVSAVWTGYDKDQKIKTAKERGYSKHIWADFMEEALKDAPVYSFKPTEGVVGVLINPETGLLATDECPIQRFTYFIKGTEPTEYCSEHGGSGASRKNDNGENKENRLPDMTEKETPWYRKLFNWLN